MSKPFFNVLVKARWFFHATLNSKGEGVSKYNVCTVQYVFHMLSYYENYVFVIHPGYGSYNPYGTVGYGGSMDRRGGGGSIRKGLFTPLFLEDV